ncbi:hypothetical protein EJM69_21360 [Clostridium botulinum]|nr:hypothetical protein [Clostridium botulinum]
MKKSNSPRQILSKSKNNSIKSKNNSIKSNVYIVYILLFANNYYTYY